jgi:UDP-2,3-diacylglucosamine pyrophosphatase LpxH
VIFKFCFKEGCRLLHLLDYIGLIGLTSMTLSSRSSCYLRQARNQIMSQRTTIEQLHLMIRDELNRLPDTLDNNSHCAGETHQHLHRAVARHIRPTMAEALNSTDWTPATRLITTEFSEL